MDHPNSVQTAVILLAGNDPLQNDAAAQLPYGLVEVDGRTLLHCAVERLLHLGFARILLITGRESKATQSVAQHPAVEIIHDALFADFGSMFALRRAARHISFPFVLLESNILFESRLVQLAQTLPYANGILVSTANKIMGSIVAEGVNDQLLSLAHTNSQTVQCVDQTQFSLGVYKISRQMFARMLTYATDRTYTDPFLDHIDCINAISQAVDIRILPESNLLWTQVNSRVDTIWAMRHISPEITQQEEQSR